MEDDTRCVEITSSKCYRRQFLNDIGDCEYCATGMVKDVSDKGRSCRLYECEDTYKLTYDA